MLVLGVQFLVFVLCGFGNCQSPVIDVTTEFTSLSNGYVSVFIDTRGTAFISKLFGDYEGLSNYGMNLLGGEGFRLERENSDGQIVSAAGEGPPSTVNVIQMTETCVSVEIQNIKDDLLETIYEETWNLSLCAFQRSFTFASKGVSTGVNLGNITGVKNSIEFRSIRHSLYSMLISTTGFYDLGVVQILNAPNREQYFSSIDVLQRTYMLGGGGAIDIIPLDDNNNSNLNTVLMNAQDGAKSFRSGYMEIIAGGVSKRDRWDVGSTEDDSQALGHSVQWSRSLKISPSNKNFPSGSLPDGNVPNMISSDDVEVSAAPTRIVWYRTVWYVSIC